MVILCVIMIEPTFQSVNHVALSEWGFAPKALSRAKPGDLLHTGELCDKKGGMLKIRNTGSFITVSANQAWNGSPIPWPRAEDGVKEIVIEPGTDQVRFIPRVRPECCPSSEDDASSPSSS